MPPLPSPLLLALWLLPWPEPERLPPLLNASGVLAIAAAREQAYAAVSHIRYDGAFCRRDIAHRALRRD